MNTKLEKKIEDARDALHGFDNNLATMWNRAVDGNMIDLLRRNDLARLALRKALAALEEIDTFAHEGAAK